MKKRKTLIVIDMNNGFSKKGSLYSPNVEKLIFPIKEYVKSIKKEDGEIIYYSDAHSIKDEEFKTFPVHCLKGTEESQYVDELKGFEDYYIEKDTTNGFKTTNPLEIIKNKDSDLYVCGCVTDICVYNFVCSMLEYIHENKLKNHVIVMEDLVATFDGPNNDAKERHDQAIKEMYLKGADIETTKTLKNTCRR